MYIDWDDLGGPLSGAVPLFTEDLDLGEHEGFYLGDDACLLEIRARYGSNVVRHVYPQWNGPYFFDRARAVIQWFDRLITEHVGAERSAYGRIVVAHRLTSVDQVQLASYAVIPRDIAGLDPSDLPMRVPEVGPKWYTG